MKKIITLLFAVGAFAAANAQYSREEARTVVLGNQGYSNNHNGYGYSNNYASPREIQIARVTREYDELIRSVWSDPFLSHGQKERKTRRLEKERDSRICDINRDFSRDHDRRNW